MLGALQGIHNVWSLVGAQTKDILDAFRYCHDTAIKDTWRRYAGPTTTLVLFYTTNTLDLAIKLYLERLAVRHIDSRLIWAPPSSIRKDNAYPLLAAVCARQTPHALLAHIRKLGSIKIRQTSTIHSGSRTLRKCSVAPLLG